MSGRKLPSNFENPIDDKILNQLDTILPWLIQTKVTPNQITVLSFVFGLISLYQLHYKDNYILFALCFTIGYILDCLDGHLARASNQTSKYGDLLDHTTDITVGISLIIVCLLKYQNASSPKIIMIFLFFMVAMQSHIGCQQILKQQTKNDPGETLDINSRLCHLPAEKSIQLTRWFGTGSFHLFAIGLIGYLHYNK